MNTRMRSVVTLLRAAALVAICCGHTCCLPALCQSLGGGGGATFMATGAGYISYTSVSSDWSLVSSSVDYSGAGYCSYGADWITASASVGQGTVSGSTVTTDRFDYVGFLSESTLSITILSTATAFISIPGQSASGFAQATPDVSEGVGSFYAAAISNSSYTGTNLSTQTTGHMSWIGVDTTFGASQYMINTTSASASSP